MLVNTKASVISSTAHQGNHGDGEGFKVQPSFSQPLTPCFINASLLAGICPADSVTRQMPLLSPGPLFAGFGPLSHPQPDALRCSETHNLSLSQVGSSYSRSGLQITPASLISISSRESQEILTITLGY